MTEYPVAKTDCTNQVDTLVATFTGKSVGEAIQLAVEWLKQQTVKISAMHKHTIDLLNGTATFTVY